MKTHKLWVFNEKMIVEIPDCCILMHPDLCCARIYILILMGVWGQRSATASKTMTRGVKVTKFHVLSSRAAVHTMHDETESLSRFICASCRCGYHDGELLMGFDGAGIMLGVVAKDRV